MAVSRILGEHRDALISAEDLSDKLFHLVYINEDGQVALANATSTVRGAILQGAPAGRPTTFSTGSMVNVIAGGVIAADAPVGSNASGQAIQVAADAPNIFGYARKAVDAAGKVAEIHTK